MTNLTVAILSVVSSIVSLIIGLIIRHFFIKTSSDKRAEETVNESIKQAKKIIYNAKAEIREKEILLEKESNQKQKELEKILENFQVSNDIRLKSISERENLLEKQEEEITRKREEISFEKRRLHREYSDKFIELEEKIDEQISMLSNIANLTEQEAKEEILNGVKIKLTKYIEKEYANAYNNLEFKKKEMAREILANTIDRYAESVVGERSTTFITLPNEELKGKIIGKEGRNIRAFEACSGVDLLIDDDPKKIRISSFNPIRREIARLTLESLIEKGTIQPSNIEEEYEIKTSEFEEHLIEIGKKAVFDANIGFVHKDLLPIIGRLQYRSSYGQNALTHTNEVAKLAGMMAEKIEANPLTARRVAFFHDIGKAVDYEDNGDHVDVGYRLAQKYELEKEVLNAIKSHHGHEPHQSVYAVLTRAADAISSARPGARQNSYEEFVERMETVERICKKHEGVKKAYALSSGRQVRVMVAPNIISDSASKKLAIDIAQELETELKIPGEIKITVIREFRVTQKANKKNKESL